MTTDSQNSFVKVKLWFTKLVNLEHSEQALEIKQLKDGNILVDADIILLKSMLQADLESDLATSIQSASHNVASEACCETPSIKQKQIGPYQIIEPLGEGGMGQVYLAMRNDGVFEQKVALKLPHSSFNTEMLKRFENERQILAQLTHNNIARLLDGGTTENNQPYLVMEYIQGKNIDDYCIEKIPTLNERLKLILQICSAVTFSHQQLVLHRDLKPSNILVTDDGQVKLLDFGIAKLLDIDEEAKAKQTATQIMTRYYASPEQLQGKPASTHSDLFSLAIIAYELITGFHPFNHETQHEREQNLISGKIRRVTQYTEDSKPLLPELSKIPTAKLQGDLENILLKALSVDPNKRYANTKEFADDLNNFIDNKPVSARKPSKVYYLKKLIQRNKITAFTIFLTVNVLIGSSIFSFKKAIEAEKQRNFAVIESVKSKQIAEFLQNMFKKARPLQGNKEVHAQDLLDQALYAINNKTELDVETKYNLSAVIFNSYIYLGKMAKIQERVEHDYLQCIKQLSATNLSCQEILLTKAALELKNGHNQQSLEYYLQAEDLARNQTPLNKSLLANILTYQYPVLINLNQSELAIQKSKESIKLFSQLPNIKSVTKINTLIRLSYISIGNGEYNQGKYYLNEMYNYLIDTHQEKNEAMARYNNIWGYLYGAQHNQKKTLKYRKRAIDILNDNYIIKPTQLGFYLVNYARALYRSGDFNKGLIIYQKAYDFYQEFPSKYLSKKISILINMTLVHFIQNDNKKALATYDKALLLGIENISDSITSQCYYKTAKTQLSVFFDEDNVIEKNIDDLALCKIYGDKSIIYEIYWHVINAQVALKLRKTNRVIKSLENADTILQRFPDDYFGLKKLVKDTRNKL